MNNTNRPRVLDGAPWPLLPGIGIFVSSSWFGALGFEFPMGFLGWLCLVVMCPPQVLLLLQVCCFVVSCGPGLWVMLLDGEMGGPEKALLVCPHLFLAKKAQASLAFMT